LWQAVVRSLYGENIGTAQTETGRVGVYPDPSDYTLLGEGATEAEAWRAAAVKVLEQAGYRVKKISDGLTPWVWVHAPSSTASSLSYTTLKLAQDDAMRDHLHRVPEPVIAQPVQAELKVAHTVYGLMYDKEAVDALLLQSQAELAEARKLDLERFTKITELLDEVAAAEQQVAELTAKLQRIQEWCDAYPLEMFPKPDMAEAQRRLGDALLSSVSADNFRHVLEGIRRITGPALTKQEGGAHGIR
jgi:hypothetical protein